MALVSASDPVWICSDFFSPLEELEYFHEKVLENPFKKKTKTKHVTVKETVEEEKRRD